MAKALVIHSAAFAESGLSAGDLHYRGFGMPRDVEDVLSCEKWRATLLFELDVHSGNDLARAPFPIPTCLRDTEGRLRAEILATLVTEPPMDGQFGAEYCRTNVNVSLGTCDENGSGQKREVHPFPPTPVVSAMEVVLVENGFKWSPVKVYRRRMPKGVDAANWRLLVDATDRSGANREPVHAALVVTIADLDRQDDVYSSVVAEMNRLGWATTDVQFRQQARGRP